MDMNIVYQVAALLATLGMGYLIGRVQYEKAKTILDAVTRLLVEINTAMKDDRLTKAEIKAIHQKIRDLIAIIKRGAGC